MENLRKSLSVSTIHSFNRYFRCKFYIKKPPPELTAAELKQLVKKLDLCCLRHTNDLYRIHINRLKGIRILEKIITRSSPYNLQPEMVIIMIWSCLSCLHHFLLRFSSSDCFTRRMKRNQFNKAIEIYEDLLQTVLSHMYSVSLQAHLTFLTEANLWSIEYLCSEILCRLFQFSQNYSLIIDEIFERVEIFSLNNLALARQILYVLNEALKSYKLNEVLCHKFIVLYYDCLKEDTTLHKGLEICLKTIAENCDQKILLYMIESMLRKLFMEEISEHALLNYGDVLDYAATKCRKTLYKYILIPTIFPLLLKLIKSDNVLFCLLGCRIMQNLVDRCGNRWKMNAPKVYFRNTIHDYKLQQYNEKDKTFFRKYRAIIHSTFLNAILEHGTNKMALENIYVTIILFFVEIPCSYTAAAGVCLAMGIQEKVLANTNISAIQAHRLHAIVISMITLICSIHNATVFYEYVCKILRRRAHFAPHLLPPIRTNYHYAEHNVLWNKPDLFFEDWENRYGLWKCFRSKNME